MNASSVQWLLAAAAILSAACAVYSAWRASRWRDGDEARALLGRLAQLEKQGEMTELKLIGLPSAADLARLSAEVRTVNVMVEQAEKSVDRAERGVERVERGVERIETWLMERGSGS